ncbi:hypothetical protein ACA910_004858 [Epithemia clementina (nom. ined.)]
MPPNTSHNASYRPQQYQEANHEEMGESSGSATSNKQLGVRFSKVSSTSDQPVQHEEFELPENKVSRQQGQQDHHHQQNTSLGGTGPDSGINQTMSNLAENFSYQTNNFDGYIHGGGPSPSMFGGGGGMSPYYGGYGSSPYSSYSGMYTPMGMGVPGPLSSLNQFLFGVQSVIFSLGQAVQIIGMNTQALKQLFESVASMIDHAMVSWNEMRRLDASAQMEESDEEKKKRRRVKALRWTVVAATSYLGYRLARRLLSRRQVAHSQIYDRTLTEGSHASGPLGQAAPCPKCGRSGF